MRTSKPFATITYNTSDFLVLKLDELVKQGVIDFYFFVEHLKEDDEEKAHKHLYVVPNGLYDAAKLIDYLKEFDSRKPDKPLTCIMPRPSKFADAYFYFLHDKDYLMTKGQARKYHYTLDDIKTSSKDYLNELIHQIDMSKMNRMTIIRDSVKKGISFAELVASGQIPVQLIGQYEKAYNVTQEFTFRNNRKTHTPKAPKFDDDGVLIEDDE